MSDRHSQLHPVPDGLSLASAAAHPLRVPFGRTIEWFKRRCEAYEFSGFGALVGGLLLFAPLIDGGTTQLPVLVIRLLLLAGGVIWLLHRMKGGELFLPRTRFDVFAALFVVWTILTFGWSPYKNASLQWVLSLLSYAGFFMMVAYGLRSQRELRTPLLLVTLMGVCNGVWGIAQYVWMGELRAQGTFFNPNFFAAYEAAVFVLTLGTLFFAERNALSPYVSGWLKCAAAVSLTAVVLAQSRGASAALAAVAIGLGVFRYGKKAILLTTVCLLALFLVPNPLQQRIVHVSGDPYAYTRLEIWTSALGRLADRPLGIGVGMFKQGSFQERFPLEGDIVRYRKRPESAHNEYLQMGVELGIVGLVLFFCAAALWAAEVVRLLRQPRDGTERGMLVGATAAALVLLVHAAVDSTFHEPALVMLLVLTGGVAHHFYVRDRSYGVTWQRIGFPSRPSAVACVMGGALLIAAVCVQSAVAWYAHEEGKRRASHDELDAALAWYVRAADIDPGTTGYHDSIARTAMQLFDRSAKPDWLLKAAEEEAVARHLNPLDGRFAFRAGTVYRLMASQTITAAQRNQLLKEASDAYEAAIRLDPYSPFSYLELAQLRLADGRREEAIALLKTATAHEPNFLPGRVLLAETSLRAGIPGDYPREYAAIKAVRSRYAHRDLSETERRFLDVDLYPLGRALAMESIR